MCVADRALRAVERSLALLQGLQRLVQSGERASASLDRARECSLGLLPLARQGLDGLRSSHRVQPARQLLQGLLSGRCRLGQLLGLLRGQTLQPPLVGEELLPLHDQRLVLARQVDELLQPAQLIAPHAAEMALESGQPLPRLTAGEPERVELGPGLRGVVQQHLQRRRRVPDQLARGLAHRRQALPGLRRRFVQRPASRLHGGQRPGRHVTSRLRIRDGSRGPRDVVVQVADSTARPAHVGVDGGGLTLEAASLRTDEAQLQLQPGDGARGGRLAIQQTPQLELGRSAALRHEQERTPLVFLRLQHLLSDVCLVAHQAVELPAQGLHLLPRIIEGAGVCDIAPLPAQRALGVERLDGVVHGPAGHADLQLRRRGPGDSVRDLPAQGLEGTGLRQMGRERRRHLQVADSQERAERLERVRCLQSARSARRRQGQQQRDGRRRLLAGDVEACLSVPLGVRDLPVERLDARVVRPTSGVAVEREQARLADPNVLVDACLGRQQLPERRTWRGQVGRGERSRDLDHGRSRAGGRELTARGRKQRLGDGATLLRVRGLGLHCGEIAGQLTHTPRCRLPPRLE